MNRLNTIIATLVITTALTSFVPPFSYTRSTPNIHGGADYETPEGKVQSFPNIFGGLTYKFPSGRIVQCTPNIFGGQDCK